jgi:hypothetical protein
MKRGSTWTYVLHLGRDASGKKQQKWVGGHRTRKEAEDALIQPLERMRAGRAWRAVARASVAVRPSCSAPAASTARVGSPLGVLVVALGVRLEEHDSPGPLYLVRSRTR